MAKVLGIDLGTTNSAMAVLEGGEPSIIINAEGDRTTPSVVAFRKDGERIAGRSAKNQAITNPENTVKSIKRFIGRKFEETTSERKTVAFKATVLRSDVVSSNLRPMNRLMDFTVFSGFVIAWFLAERPAMRSPSLRNATTEGVVRSPSALMMME